jgi:hypothetical protein
MKYEEIVGDAGSADAISVTAEKNDASDFRLGLAGKDGMQTMRLLVADDTIQSVLDALQNALGARPSS